MDAYRLGIDYGTSNTVAVLHWPDGRTRPLLFDSSPLLPSAVYAAPDGRLLVGRDAERHSRIHPGRFEPNPKRCVADGSVLLGERTVPVVELIAATLAEVAGEAARVAGEAPADVVVTYPATWGALRRTVLTDAAMAAGLPRPRLLPEPVAAAAYFAKSVGHRVADGQVVVVYDLGGGTLDVSAVRRKPDGFEVVAVEGMPEFGGVDLDAVLVRLIGRGVEPAEWSRVLSPTTDDERRWARTLWDDARAAKESLSRQPNSSVFLHTTGRDLQVGREAFWEAAREYLGPTAELTRTVVTRVGAEEVAGLFLVGGSTRMPLVATILHQATGIAPTVLEQPELVVAEGALQATLPRVPEPAADDSADFIIVESALPAEDIVVEHAPPTPVHTPAPAPVRRAPAFTPTAPAPAPPKKAATRRFILWIVILLIASVATSWILEQATKGDDGGIGADDPGVGSEDVGDGRPSDSGTVYTYDVDLCDGTDLTPVEDIAGTVFGDPAPEAPVSGGDGAGTTACTFTLRKSSSEVFSLRVEADVYAESGGLSHSTSIAGSTDSGDLAIGVTGATATYSYMRNTTAGIANHVYSAGAVSENLVLSVSFTGVSSDGDLGRPDFDEAVAALMEQVMGELRSA